jgi:hypothetical protein
VQGRVGMGCISLDAYAAELVCLLIRIPAKLKTKIAELAQRQRRSINKQIEFLLASAIKRETAADRGTSAKRAKYE